MERDPPLAVTFRHSGWTHDRRLIFEAFWRTRQPLSRRTEFEYCGAHAYVLRSIENPDVYRVAGSSCHDRFCLPCANERSHGIALNVMERVTGKQLRFLTLTIRSTDESLEQLLLKLFSAFQNLRRRQFWKRRVTGGVAFLEVTWSATKERWHPHFHILIEGKFLPYNELRALWYEVTGDSHVIDIRLVRDNRMASRYVTKYASKPFNNTYVNRPERLDEAIVALKGRKLLITFGSWRGITLARTIAEGAWDNVGSLLQFIASAANGDKSAQAILRSLTDTDLTPLYARAPPWDAPVTTVPPATTQLSFFGVWQRNGSFSYPMDSHP